MKALKKGYNPESKLLLFQQLILSLVSKHRFNVFEKSRRIGFSWTLASDCVLYSASDKGGDTYYMCQAKETAETFIKDCEYWAKLFEKVTSSRNIEIFEEGDKSVTKYFIEFASGFRIVAISNSPSGFRGKGKPTDRFILDEAAFHPQLEEAINALSPVLMWGCKIIILSTHNGENSYFNFFLNKIKKGEIPANTYKVTFRDAIEQGLYQKICDETNQKWTPENEKIFVEMMYKSNPNASEELDVIPRGGSGMFISPRLIHTCVNRDTREINIVWHPL